ncbi:hypothetical protein P171DRAFT_480311 [Karstenula rhodostoma CBS 690.94]|uniref:BTB domain-containing protein n=1 Tax=Karstenula rhodostoma CBS 690.94 TaxID=1392251 RepID=A0A9P4PUK5_9PLEO|nr:hypothetical protein P171DRAFT_480311 [Karstenula rhodostoma CBS 690.94]
MASATQGATAASSSKPPLRSLPRISSASPIFATVFVGSSKARFVVHEELLAHYSEFFRAALQGGFAEAETKTITLDDVAPHTFELFVHWLYYQRFR